MNASRLPAGFEFPLRRAHLKALLAPYSGTVSLSLSGISYSEQSKKPSAQATVKWFWVGIVDAVPRADGWHFSIAIHGVRSGRLASRRDAIEALLSADMVGFIKQTICLPSTDPAASGPRSLHLGFELGSNEVVSRSFVPPRH